MTDFYADSLDLWAWPVVVDDTNDEVKIIEDPGDGGSNDSFTVELEHTAAFTNSTHYYALAPLPTVDGTYNGEYKLVDTGAKEVWAKSLYSEIVSKLRANSPNNLDYEISASDSSTSDFTNTSLTLTTAGGSTDFTLDQPAASNPLSIRFFGFREGSAARISSSGSLAGTVSRWGTWFSPVVANDKRKKLRRKTFQSTANPWSAKRWRWTREWIKRQIRYVGVAGVHVWAQDRASRSSEADRGGLAYGDNNNALETVYDSTGFDAQHVIIGHEKGEASMGNTLVSADFGVKLADDSEVARLDREWLTNFAPQDDTDRQHKGEKYDITLPITVNQPADSTNGTYEH